MHNDSIFKVSENVLQLAIFKLFTFFAVKLR